MALYKIRDFSPNYHQEASEGEAIEGYEVYSGKNDRKIGTVDDILVDHAGYIRYLVIKVENSHKTVLLPVGGSRFNDEVKRVYVKGINRRQDLERLPEYREDRPINEEYEEQIRRSYQMPAVESTASVEDTPSVEATGIEAVNISRPKTSPTAKPQPKRVPAPEPEVEEVIEPRRRQEPEAEVVERPSRIYERQPELYTTNEQEHPRLRLHEERLVAHKNRVKSGEVTLGKRVETETAHTSVPVDKERIVIERKSPTNQATPATPGETDFRAGKVANMEIYEETAQIEKQPFVREEVNVSKEVEHGRVEATETLRHEELEIDTEGQTTVERSRPPQEPRP